MAHEYEDWQIFNSPGECPVAGGLKGQTHLANETRHQAEKRPPYAISALAWDLGLDRPGRIIAYRVLKEPKPFDPDWYMDPLTLHRLPPDCAPKGAPVLVAGGVAMKKTCGKWFSGMSDEPFTRELNWEPKWWSPIPQQND